MKNNILIVISMIAITLMIGLSSSAKTDKYNFNGEITISELKTKNNITTILVKVKNTSQKKYQVVIPATQQDSFCLRLPWEFKILQNNIEYGSQWVALGFGFSIGKFKKIKGNEIVTFQIDILWDYMIDNKHKKIIPDKDTYITLFYYPIPIDMNKKISSNTITIHLR